MGDFLGQKRGTFGTKSGHFPGPKVDTFRVNFLHTWKHIFTVGFWMFVACFQVQKVDSKSVHFLSPKVPLFVPKSATFFVGTPKRWYLQYELVFGDKMTTKTHAIEGLSWLPRSGDSGKLGDSTSGVDTDTNNITILTKRCHSVGCVGSKEGQNVGFSVGEVGFNDQENYGKLTSFPAETVTRIKHCIPNN